MEVITAVSLLDPLFMDCLNISFIPYQTNKNLFICLMLVTCQIFKNALTSEESNDSIRDEAVICTDRCSLNCSRLKDEFLFKSLRTEENRKAESKLKH